MERSPITTHVLDTSRGKPVAGMEVVLEKKDGAGWTSLGRGATDADGRVVDLLRSDHLLAQGTYRLTFFTGAAMSGFFPEVTISFSVDDPAQHYHVPLLVSPFGYTTYRGT
jgi:5-hydroxyisourate hydrolase